MTTHMGPPCASRQVLPVHHLSPGRGVHSQKTALARQTGSRQMTRLLLDPVSDSTGLSRSAPPSLNAAVEGLPDSLTAGVHHAPCPTLHTPSPTPLPDRARDQTEQDPNLLRGAVQCSAVQCSAACKPPIRPPGTFKKLCSRGDLKATFGAGLVCAARAARQNNLWVQNIAINSN